MNFLNSYSTVYVLALIILILPAYQSTNLDLSERHLNALNPSENTDASQDEFMNAQEYDEAFDLDRDYYETLDLGLPIVGGEPSSTPYRPRSSPVLPQRTTSEPIINDDNQEPDEISWEEKELIHLRPFLDGILNRLNLPVRMDPYSAHQLALDVTPLNGRSTPSPNSPIHLSFELQRLKGRYQMMIRFHPDRVKRALRRACQTNTLKLCFTPVEYRILILTQNNQEQKQQQQPIVLKQIAMESHDIAKGEVRFGFWLADLRMGIRSAIYNARVLNAKQIHVQFLVNAKRSPDWKLLEDLHVDLIDLATRS